MACHICSQVFHAKRKPVCASCARATLYRPRVQQLSLLLNKNNAQVEAILRPGNDGVLASLPQDADWDAITTGIKKESTVRLQEDFVLATARLQALDDRVKELSGSVLSLRDQITIKSTAAKQRQTELQQSHARLSSQKSSIETVDAHYQKSQNKLNRVHHRSADARASLCRTAAVLAGLKQEVHNRKPTGRIVLGRLPICDLRELGTIKDASSFQPMRAVDIEEEQRQATNASLDHICRLVAIWSHYLSISTPAEVLLPHNDFAHSAILPQKSSYRIKIVQPGSSPTTSRNLFDGSSSVRPRILHLDRPMSKLAKEDPKAFGLYIEGITLLAWNIAWLCKSQGIGAINTFDEVCDIGHNLWLFYRMADTRAAEASSARRLPSSLPHRQETSFGVMSHGTVLHSLAGHEGAQLLQNWRLLQPHRLIDKLRLLLLTELTGAEWDVLSEHDYDEEPGDEQAVLVGGHARKERDVAAGMSIMSVRDDHTNEEHSAQEKGWMKVRGRPTGAI